MTGFVDKSTRLLRRINTPIDICHDCLTSDALSVRAQMLVVHCYSPIPGTQHLEALI